MNEVRVGRIVHVLRFRVGWRQVDVAERARVSQQTVSAIETGKLRRVSLDKLERVLAVLEADVDLIVRWRGGQLDRLLDSGHARLVAAIALRLRSSGWLVAPEVTYAIYRERGSIDILAFHPTTGDLLVVEVKTELLSIEETLRRHDEKTRLALRIARDRLGWQGRRVSRLLVLPEGRTPRRHVADHDSILQPVYPLRGRALSRWLRGPDSAAGGLMFLSFTTEAGTRRGLMPARRVATSRRAAA